MLHRDASSKVVLLRFRSPSAQGIYLLQRPGTSACLTALIIVSLHIIGFVAWWAVVTSLKRTLFRPHMAQVLDGLGAKTGAATVACWVLLSLCRARRFEWDWIEALGCYSAAFGSFRYSLMQYSLGLPGYKSGLFGRICGLKSQERVGSGRRRVSRPAPVGILSSNPLARNRRRFVLGRKYRILKHRSVKMELPRFIDPGSASGCVSRRSSIGLRSSEIRHAKSGRPGRSGADPRSSHRSGFARHNTSFVTTPRSEIQTGDFISDVIANVYIHVTRRRSFFTRSRR